MAGNRIKRAALALTFAALAGTSATPLIAQTRGADALHAGTLEVPLNKSQVVSADRPIARAMVGSAEIADVLPITDRSIYVLGKKMGTTSLTLYDKLGRVISIMDIAVGPDVIALEDQLHQLVPNEQIEAHISNESIVLTGMVNSAGAADRAMQLARSYAGEKPVINMISLGSSQQVMLEVRFAEVSRSTNRDVGVQAMASSANGNFGSATGNGSSYIPGGTQTTSTTTSNFNSSNGTNSSNTTTNNSAIGNASGSATSSSVNTNGSAQGSTNLSGTIGQFQNPNFLDGKTLTGSGGGGFNSAAGASTTGSSNTSSGVNAVGVVGSVLGSLASTATSVATTSIGDVLQMGSITSGFGIFRQRFNIGGLAINAVLNAMESKGLSKTLAQPTLVAISGQKASFLAGGEFPVPVPQTGGGGGANAGAITVEFKPFGVSLAFTPTVLGDKTISMIVEPEVSSIDPSASISINGITIPGLRTRRASTSIELRDGESFAIAGLISKDFQTTVRQVPLLGSIPILGSLFRSSAFQKGETELMIVVTPHLVSPIRPNQVRLPTDAISDPDGAATVFLGRPSVARPVGPTAAPGEPVSAASPGKATGSAAAPAQSSAAAAELPPAVANNAAKEPTYAY